MLLSELCFSGYFFKDKEDVKKVAEFKNKGLTYDWCKKTALRLNSYVIACYPEKVILNEDDRLKTKLDKEEYYRHKKTKDKDETLYYISQLVVDREGNVVTSYRKHFLWYAHDARWANEGEEYKQITITNKSGVEIKVGLGICNDLFRIGKQTGFRNGVGNSNSKNYFGLVH